MNAASSRDKPGWTPFATPLFMKLLKLFVVFALLNLPAQVMSQTVHYDIMIAGRTVGSVKVLYDGAEPESAKRRIDAEVSIPFYSGNLRSENQFVDGVLKTSVTDYRVNGKKKEKTLTSKAQSGQYQVDFLGACDEFEKRKDVRQGITKTIVNLYYEEPVNVHAVYSEKYGQMCRLENMGDGRYAVTMPSGKQTLYSYSNGRCREVSMELAGVKLRMVRKEMQLAQK